MADVNQETGHGVVITDACYETETKCYTEVTGEIDNYCGIKSSLLDCDSILFQM